MDLRVLNYFLTVAKEGNITHAADIPLPAVPLIIQGKTGRRSRSFMCDSD